MVDLPEDVAMSLVRGVGAYLRATPPQELPAKLRRFRSFRPQSLGPHRNELLAVLEDAALRARIGEWLEKERPNLPRKDADALRVAAAGADGWQDDLRARSDARPKRRPAGAAEDGKRLEAEREKVKKAREEARRVKDEARARLEEQRAKVTELTAALKDVARRLAESERAAAAASKEATRSVERLERELRKARASLEKAEAERDAAKNGVKEARREIAGLKREVAAVKQELATRKRSASQARTRPAPRRRRPLPVPKGRLEDAPETLDSWLRSPNVHLVIDGYNVAKAEGGFGGLRLEEQRDRLVQEVTKLAHRVPGRTIVVFDGSKVAPGLARRSRSKAEVEYSRPDEIADDHIVALLEKLPPDPVVLVTNDRELQDRGAALDATVARSDQLLALIR